MDAENFNKKKFIDELYKAYVFIYMNTNLHCLSEMFKTLKMMTTCKMTQKDMFASYDRIKHLILDHHFETIDNLSDFARSEEDVIKYFDKESPLLLKLKHIISSKAYGLLNVIYYNVLRNTGFDIIISSLQTFLSLKHKEFSSDPTLNMVDILINILVHVVKEKDDSHLTKFMMISREILYFKGSAKAIKERAVKSKIIPTLIHVMIHKNAIDISKPIAVAPKEKYLYVVCNKDVHTRLAIEREKDTMIRRRPELKNVKATLPTPSGGRVDIVKLYEYN